MPTPTYTPIARQVLASATNTLTFSSIPNTYTDLVLVTDASFSGYDYLVYQFNGDTGSNYSETPLRGNGSTATSGGAGNRVFTWTCLQSAANTQFNTVSNFMNYSNTTTNKTLLSRANSNSSGDFVATTAGLWRSTSAINSIRVYSLSANNFNVGSTFTLYGIKAGS